MRAKIGIGLIIALFILLALPAIYAQATATCSDGTAEWSCSSSTPGTVCVPSGSADQLVDVHGSDCPMAADVCAQYAADPKCACPSGYTIDPQTGCVKTSCTDPTSGQTINNGACASTKPGRCLNGNVVNDATQCGCPAGQQASPDGKTCVVSTGCRWHNPDCSSTSDCNYTASDATDPGVCKPKQGCAFGTVTCLDSQTCDTSANANGVCKDKPGCQYLNPACAKGQVCVNNACQTAATGGSGDTTLGNGATTANNSTGATTSSNPLSCCCLPSMGAVTLVGLALFKRQDENEE